MISILPTLIVPSLCDPNLGIHPQSSQIGAPSFLCKSHHCLGILLNLFFLKKNKPWKKNIIFALYYGSWEALDACEILLKVVGTICPPGNPHSARKNSLNFFRLSEQWWEIASQSLMCFGYTSGPSLKNAQKMSKYIFWVHFKMSRKCKKNVTIHFLIFFKHFAVMLCCTQKKAEKTFSRYFKDILCWSV